MTAATLTRTTRSAYPTAVPVSALTGDGVDDLRLAIDRALAQL